MSGPFTHLDANGQARMVDVSAKAITTREAIACGSIHMSRDVIAMIKAESVPKGNVLATARIAGILAAKRVDELIPLCHTLALASIEISFEMKKEHIVIRSRVKCDGKTGVEMEALTAVTVAALTIYDMCKAVDKSMTLGPFYLEKKSGGKSGVYQR